MDLATAGITLTATLAAIAILGRIGRGWGLVRTHITAGVVESQQQGVENQNRMVAKLSQLSLDFQHLADCVKIGHDDSAQRWTEHGELHAERQSAGYSAVSRMDRMELRVLELEKARDSGRST